MEISAGTKDKSIARERKNAVGLFDPLILLGDVLCILNFVLSLYPAYYCGALHAG